MNLSVLINKTIFISPFTLENCTTIFVYNSKITGLIPTKDNLDEIVNQVKNLINSNGGQYKDCICHKEENEDGNQSYIATITPFENLAYSPTDGFDIIIYQKTSQLLGIEFPMGFSILGEVIGSMKIGATENIYPDKIDIDFTGIVFPEETEEISESDYLINLSEVADLTKRSLITFKKRDQLSGASYIVDDGMKIANQRILHRIRQGKGKSDVTDPSKYWFGYSIINNPTVFTNRGSNIYDLTNATYMEDLPYYRYYGSGRCRFYQSEPIDHDMFRTTSFAIVREGTETKEKFGVVRSSTKDITGYEFLSPNSTHNPQLNRINRPLIDIWSPKIVYSNSVFSNINEFQHSIPDSVNISLPLRQLLNDQGKLFVVCKFGQWFLFYLSQYDILILINSYTSIAISNLNKEEIMVVNEKTVLIRDGEGALYLFNEEGDWCTPQTKKEILIKFPYSNLLKRFEENTKGLIDERSFLTIYSGPLKLYRKYRYPDPNVTDIKIIGAIGGLIFYEYIEINEAGQTFYIIDYL